MQTLSGRAKLGRFIALSIGLCLVSALGTRAIRTDWGRTAIKTVLVETREGYSLSADIYRPSSATAERPAPLVVLAHGGTTSKERMEHFAVELSRRGYVAISVDMYCHGFSEVLPDSKWTSSGRGMYDAVRFASGLSYVDKDRIALLGVSRGGKAVSESLVADNQEGRRVKAAFMIHADPIYKDAKGFIDVYGARAAGVIADKNDEFFFSEKKDDTGVYVNDANKYAQILTSPRDYIVNKSAQSFLNFGVDPAGLEARKGETVYSKPYEGGTGTRVIYVTNEVHQGAEFSPRVMRISMDFIQANVPAPKPLGAADQTFLWNYAFSLLGIVGLLLFLVGLVLYLAEETKLFAAAKLSSPELASASDAAGRLWFWGLQVLGLAGTILIIKTLNQVKLSAYWDSLFRNGNAVYYGLICLLGGSLGIVLSLLWYAFYGKRHGFELKATGIFASGKAIGLSALAALTGVLAVYLVLFATGYFLGTDYYMIQWGFVVFGAHRIPGILIALPLFVVGFTLMSISVNCFNFTDVFGTSKLANNLIVSAFQALPTLAVILYVFGSLILAGRNPMIGGLRSAATALAPFPPITFAMVFIARAIYQRTGNAYLGGFANGLLATVFVWGVSEIRMPEPGAFLAPKPVLIIPILLGFAVAAGSALYLRAAAKREL
ncbi:MAG TPA: CocE/NonD family hydrolase [Spirochaetales bacterium]|nr:CocE/NonD family hydrolase [Spirochaetales bacterium]HRZ64403.1 CocE/NonD family hydrolase [Spirochaetia bacterium]